MHSVQRLMMFGSYWRVGRRNGNRWEIRIVKAYSATAALADFRRETGDPRCFAERIHRKRFV